MQGRRSTNAHRLTSLYGKNEHISFAVKVHNLRGVFTVGLYGISELMDNLVHAVGLDASPFTLDGSLDSFQRDDCVCVFDQ